MWKQVELLQEEVRINNLRIAENKLTDTLAELVMNYDGGNTYELASHEDFKRKVYDLIDALKVFKNS
jgi:hypothetical protein